MHGRRGQSLLRGHPHTAENCDDHGEDEEHAACHVDKDVGVVVFLLWTHCFRRENVKSQLKFTKFTQHFVLIPTQK